MIAELTRLIAEPGELGTIAMLLIKSTLVVSIGLGLWLALRRAPASARHLVLGATLVAIFLLPVISIVAPKVQLAVLSPPPASAEFALREAEPILSGAPAKKESNGDDAQPTAKVEAVSATNFYLLAYLLVAGLLLAHLFLGIGRVWWLSRKAKDVSGLPSWQNLTEHLDLRRTRVLQSDDLSAPLTWGVFRTIVLLPASAELWSDQDKKNALMHEFAHVERCDWLMQMVARLITALYWFNPLVWIVQRQLVLEAELAADDRVLQSGAVPDDYAEQLVTLTRCARRTSLPLAATTMAERSMLSRRVHSILNSGEKKVTLNQLSKYALICTVSAMAMLVGSVELVAAPQENSARVRTTLDIPDDISTPLIRAAAEGKNDEVLRLLQSGADVNETSENRGSKPQLPRSALTAAAEQGHLQVVQTLVDAGAPVDRVVRGDGTALIAATRRNHFEVTKYLLDRGADANLAVRGDGSPLIAATAANNTDAVRLLLERGADPDLSVRGDENPLYHAAANGNDEIMQMLIDAGVDLNQEWEGDGTALIVATRQGNASAAETLMLAGARADQGVRGDGNAMIVAAQRGDTALLQKMVASGADVNAAVKGDGSPLIQAARNGHMESVVLLLQAGADIDMVVAGDENALIGAAWRGDVEMVDYLLRSGANPNIKAESYGETRTALRQAMIEEHEEVIRLLRAAGAKE